MRAFNFLLVILGALFLSAGMIAQQKKAPGPTLGRTHWPLPDTTVHWVKPLIKQLQAEVDSLKALQQQLPADMQKVFTNNLNFELGKLQGKIEERQEKLKVLTDTTAAK